MQSTLQVAMDITAISNHKYRPIQSTEPQTGVAEKGMHARCTRLQCVSMAIKPNGRLEPGTWSLYQRLVFPYNCTMTHATLVRNTIVQRENFAEEHFVIAFKISFVLFRAVQFSKRKLAKLVELQKSQTSPTTWYYMWDTGWWWASCAMGAHSHQNGRLGCRVQHRGLMLRGSTEWGTRS